MSSVLITGGAGFIGYHLQKFLQAKYNVDAIDLIDIPTPAVALRKKLLHNIRHADIRTAFLANQNSQPNVIVHLAAETGISLSKANPQKYFDTNVLGTFNVLEQCRINGVKYLIYASSSSVYEPNQSVMAEDAKTDNQLSFYGTTKKLTEEMIKNYCKQYGITAIGLRFFTVYGSYTRTDMAAYKFMKAITNNEPITLYNNGEVYRDFTHVSDVVKSIALLIEKIKTEQAGSHQIFNIGFGNTVSIKNYAETIAKYLGKPLDNYNNISLPDNELPYTKSITKKLESYTGYKPQCSLEEGVAEMVEWFKQNRYE